MGWGLILVLWLDSWFSSLAITLHRKKELADLL